MQITLPPALEEFVREQVSSGMYDSDSEVHREALRLLMLRRDRYTRVSELRAAIDVGVGEADRGEARTCTPDDIVRLSEARQRAQGGG